MYSILRKGIVSGIILTTSVITRMLNCACSLTSNVRAGEDCWDTIKGNYDSAWQLYLRRNPHVARPQPRTKQALKRHYKVRRLCPYCCSRLKLVDQVMKERITRKGQREMNFRPFFKEFERLRLLELFLEQPDRDQICRRLILLVLIVALCVLVTQFYWFRNNLICSRRRVPCRSASKCRQAIIILVYLIQSLEIGSYFISFLKALASISFSFQSVDRLKL